MRKLLLLLPALALASCSGGHDLMSKEPFRMKCFGKEMVVSPELPQAVLKGITVNDDPPEDQVYDLTVVSPTTIRLDHEKRRFSMILDRETGAVQAGFWTEGDLPRELPFPKDLTCDFESL